MKCSRLLLSALSCLLFAPLAARADIYNLTLTPTAGGTATTFSLDTTGVTYGADAVFAGGSTFGRVDLFNGSYAPFNLGLCTNGNAGGCFSTETYYTGTPLDVQNGAGVSLLTGTFNLSSIASSAVVDHLTIVDATTTPVAVTPEPSSLMLLGTGLLGMVGIVKRRLA